MTRTVLIFGLILLAAVLPLASVPLPLTVVAVGLVPLAGDAPAPVSADVQSVALLALTFFRAPPSR